jgi:ribosomal protein L37AE/L43A
VGCGQTLAITDITEVRLSLDRVSYVHPACEHTGYRTFTNLATGEDESETNPRIVGVAGLTSDDFALPFPIYNINGTVINRLTNLFVDEAEDTEEPEDEEEEEDDRPICDYCDEHVDDVTEVHSETIFQCESCNEYFDEDSFDTDANLCNDCAGERESGDLLERIGFHLKIAARADADDL